MTTEIEAKWLNVDPEMLREALKELEAERVHSEMLMRRMNFDFPDKRLQKIGGWARVRDEGFRVTMSYKQLNDRTLHGTKEVGLIVDDFERACDFLNDLGLKPYSYQETKREQWQAGDVAVSIDTWPWIPTFVELEAPDERTLALAADGLGLLMAAALHGSVEVAYKKYFDVTDDEIDGWPEITFTEIPLDLLKKKRPE